MEKICLFKLQLDDACLIVPSWKQLPKTIYDMHISRTFNKSLEDVSAKTDADFYNSLCFNKYLIRYSKNHIQLSDDIFIITVKDSGHFNSFIAWSIEEVPEFIKTMYDPEHIGNFDRYSTNILQIERKLGTEWISMPTKPATKGWFKKKVIFSGTNFKVNVQKFKLKDLQ